MLEPSDQARQFLCGGGEKFRLVGVGECPPRRRSRVQLRVSSLVEFLLSLLAAVGAQFSPGDELDFASSTGSGFSPWAAVGGGGHCQ